MKADLTLRKRAFGDDNDYWQIRDFLRQVFLLNNRRELSWHVARFDYWWWRRDEFLDGSRIEEVTFIWDTPNGQIAAVLNPEGRGQAFFQIHPALRTDALEEEMIELAEKHIAITRNGKQKLWIWSPEDDPLRQEILKQRGYAIVEKPDTKEHQR